MKSVREQIIVYTFHKIKNQVSYEDYYKAREHLFEITSYRIYDQNRKHIMDQIRIRCNSQ
jgi:hypothetical protein